MWWLSAQLGLVPTSMSEMLGDCSLVGSLVVVVASAHFASAVQDESWVDRIGDQMIARRAGMLALLFVSCSQSCALSWASPLLGDSYLLTGTATLDKAEGLQGWKIGQETGIFVALTPDRILVGWTYSNQKPSPASRPPAEHHEVFWFLGDESGYPVNMDFVCRTGKNMLSSANRGLGAMVRQRKPTNHSAGRIGAAQVGILEEFPFAVFLASSTVDISREDVTKLLDEGPRANSRNSYGTLTAFDERGETRIEFLQGPDDELSTNLPGLRLRDFKTAPFLSGFASVRQVCTFAPGVSRHMRAPWSAVFTTERIGLTGSKTVVVYTVTVQEYITDRKRIDEEIDKVVGLVPNGYPIVTTEPISYVWHDGTIVRAVDLQGLKTAERVTFRNLSARPLIVLNIAVVLVLLFYILWRLRSPKPE